MVRIPSNRVEPPAGDLERLYAGVLGKLIGVYLGRPFEGWSRQHIVEELGEIGGYVHETFNAPLIVTDDDIAGTFTFLRALEDNESDPNLSSASFPRIQQCTGWPMRCANGTPQIQIDTQLANVLNGTMDRTYTRATVTWSRTMR